MVELLFSCDDTMIGDPDQPGFHGDTGEGTALVIHFSPEQIDGGPDFGAAVRLHEVSRPVGIGVGQGMENPENLPRGGFSIEVDGDLPQDRQLPGMDLDPVRPVAAELPADRSLILLIPQNPVVGTVDDGQSGEFVAGAEEIAFPVPGLRGPDADSPVATGQLEEFVQDPAEGGGDVGEPFGEESHVDGGKHRVGGPGNEFGGAEGDETIQIVVGEDGPNGLRDIHLAGDEPDVPAGLPELGKKALQLVLQLLRVEKEVAVKHQQPDQRDLPVGVQPAFGIGEGAAAAPGNQKSFGGQFLQRNAHGRAGDAELLRQFVGRGNPHRLTAGPVEDRHDPVPDLLHFRDGLLRLRSHCVLPALFSYGSAFYFRQPSANL